MSKYVREIDSIQELRRTPTSDAAAAHVRTPTGQSGVFVPMDKDPFGRGDDGAVALQAPNGTWWARQKAIEGKFIKAKWWGLKANDSTTDNKGAIEKALNLASVTGQIVSLPAGTIYTRPVNLPDNSKVVGQGKEETKLQIFERDGTGTNGGSLEVFKNKDRANGNKNILLKDLTVDGGRNFRAASSSNFPQESHALIDLVGCKNVQLKNVKAQRHATKPGGEPRGVVFIKNCTGVIVKECEFVKNTVEGLTVRGGKNITVADCFADGTNANGDSQMSSGYLLVDNPEKWTLENSLVRDTLGSGTNLSGTDGVVQNCKSINVGSNGFDSTEGGSQDNIKFQNCTVRNCGGAGFNMQGTRRAVVNCLVDGALRGVQYFGDQPSDERSCQISGNEIRNIADSGGANEGEGIFVTSKGGELRNVVISDNDIFEFESSGIRIRRVTTGIRITSNLIKSSKSKGKGIAINANSPTIESGILSGNFCNVAEDAGIEVNGDTSSSLFITFNEFIGGSNVSNDINVFLDSYTGCFLFGNLGSIFGDQQSIVYAGPGNNKGDRLPLKLGPYYAWMDAKNNLRIKEGSPSSLNDGDLFQTNENGSTRPSNPETGEQFFDTNLGTPIWYNGSNWVDSDGNTV